MTDRLTLDELNRHVDALVADAIEHEWHKDSDSDLAHALADGSEYVIYTHRARQVIDIVEPDEREAAFDDIRELDSRLPDTFDQLQCNLAFFILRRRFDRAIQTMRERECA